MVMMMEDVFNMDAAPMQSLVSPLADEKYAYIGWLRSEFAAANAIIDSMCHHVQSIGCSGDYETVFSCLNRRRHTWTSTLYMQQFFSVAEIVNSLQEVAQKKMQACCTPSLVNMAFNAQSTPCQDRCNNPHMQTSKSNTKWPQCQQQRTGDSNQHQESRPNVNENVVASTGNALPETVDVKGPRHSLISTSAGVAESNMPSRDNITFNKEFETSSTTNLSNKSEQCKTVEQKGPMDCEGLDVNRLLNLEVAIASKEEETRHAMIKRSMQFQCCELMDGQIIHDGESGELCESVFSSKEVDELVEVISQLQAAGRQGTLGCAFSSYEKSDNKPDIVRFGPKYNDGAKLNGHLCMPRFLQAMITWLTSCGILLGKGRPDSCLISIFNEGDFESPNTDQATWERPVCVISLLGNCNMVFGHFITTDQQGNCKGPFEVALPAGSVLLLQENFAGILQKAVPASPSRRIIITMGKALSTNTAGLSYTIAEAKARNKKWWGTTALNGCYTGTLNQARLVRGTSMHPLSHIIIPNNFNRPPVPSIQPILSFPNPTGLANTYNPDPTVLQGWQSNASSGTGVFLPSAELNTVPTWQSGLLVSVTTGLDLRRAGHPKRGEKHAKVKESFHSAMAPKPKLGKLTSSSPTDGTEGAVTTST